MAPLGLLCAASLVALAAAESILRLYDFGGWSEPPSFQGLREAHPTRGWSLAPGHTAVASTPDYSVEVRINSRGLRDVEHAEAEEGGALRIVVLGDSFAEAYQVELEDAFHRRLGATLGDRVEVINLGVGGYGTAQELILLREEGLRYEPQLVLLLFFPVNDVRNNSRILERAMWRIETLKTFGRPFAELDASGELVWRRPDFERAHAWVARMRDGLERRRSERGPLERSLFYRRLVATGRRQVDPAPLPYDGNVWLGTLLDRFDPSWPGSTLETAARYGVAWEEAWRVTEALLLEMRREVVQAGARLVVLTAPGRTQVDADFQRGIEERYPGIVLRPERPNRRLVAFCGRHDIPVLDLLPVFRGEQAAGERLFFRLRDHHWNGAGHRLAAREVARFLKETDLLPETAGR